MSKADLYYDNKLEAAHPNVQDDKDRNRILWS